MGLLFMQRGAPNLFPNVTDGILNTEKPSQKAMDVLVNECMAAKATALAYLPIEPTLRPSRCRKANFDNFHQHAKVGEVKVYLPCFLPATLGIFATTKCGPYNAISQHFFPALLPAHRPQARRGGLCKGLFPCRARRSKGSTLGSALVWLTSTNFP